MNIYVFGDSVVYGVCDDEGGWVCRLRRWWDKQKDCQYVVYNCGICGDTTTDLLARFQVEVKARVAGAIRHNEPSLIIFAIGINDAQWLKSKSALRTEADEFRSNLEKLIVLARKFPSKMMFVGITPVDEKKTMPIPWNLDKFYKNENVSKLNGIIGSVCRTAKIPFLDVNAKWLEIDYRTLLDDGLHPNTAGHKLIFEHVRDFLLSNKLL